MRRSTKIIVAILFPLVLASPGLSILLPIRPIEIENRPLAPPPEFSLTSLMSPTFYRATLSYVRSANPMRTWLIRVGAGLDFWIYDDSPNPTRVFKGTDDWLYYRPTIEEPCTTPAELVVENLTAFIQRLEQDAPTVVLTLAPSKFVIHPEHLKPEQAEIAECARLAGNRLRQLLADAPLTHYVDGWELFEQHKATGVQPYFRTDTHFNFEGSIPWMQALVEAVSDVWDPKAVQRRGQTMWLGNLMRFIGLEEPEKVEHQVVKRGLDAQVIEISPRIRHYRHAGSGGQEMISGKALVIGDSFLELPEPSFVQYFADVTTMDWRDEEGIEYLFQRAAESETVIMEISELHVWSFFADSGLRQRYESVAASRP